MISEEEYANALIEISRLRKIVEQYRKEINPYDYLKLSDIEIIKDKELHPLNAKLLGFYVNEQEVQRITESEFGYQIFHSRYFDDKDTIIKKLYNWFKRRGMKVSINDFREFVEPYFEYFENE